MPENEDKRKAALDALNDAENHLQRMSIGYHVDGTLPMNYKEWVGHCLDGHLPAIRAALSTQPAQISGMVWEDEKLQEFLGVVATCQRVNTPEWMEFLAEEMNKIFDHLKGPYVASVNSRGNISTVRKNKA